MITVAEILASLAEEQVEPVASTGRLCELCSARLGVTGAGISLWSDGSHSGIAGASDARARELEELQFSLGEGPCLDAYRQGRPILHPDFSHSAPTRWPGFAPASLAIGVAALFSFPLQLGGIRIGVLDLYRDQPGPLDTDQLGEALTYATAAVVVLLQMQSEQQGSEGPGSAPDLLDPLDYRPEVHQATGMISVQAEVGLAEALLLLKGHAFTTGRPVLDVARDVIDRRVRFGLEDEDAH